MLEMLLFIMAQWGLVTAWVANSQKRNAAVWFGIGAALPLIGLVLLLVKPSTPRYA